MSNIILKVIFAVVMLVILAIIGLFVSLFTLLIVGKAFVPLVITVFVTLYLLIIFNIFELFTNVRLKRGLFSISGLLFAVALGFIINHMYHESIPKLADASVDLDEYAPFFENTKAVSLSESAALQLTEDLPLIDGATALYPLYSAFVQATYPSKEYLYYDSEVMSSRTGEAYRRLFDGEVDMIFVLDPSAAQIEEAEQKGLKLNMTSIGKEAFVFFVNSKNPVTELTVNELKQIYSGEITNWRDVGGRNEDIRAFQRPANSGSQTALEKFMGNTPIMEPETENIASLMGDIIQIASYRNYKNSIGYTFRYYSTEMVENNQIRLLAIDGVEPTKETIRSGEYPLSSEFYVITAGSDNPHIYIFIDWILSEQGQSLVEKTGYVSIEK